MATVLVVDDDATNREFLCMLLGYYGHRVLDAADAAQALALVHREPPDAIITDVLMPGMDGYELARALRSEPATSRTPIAFYTAHYLEQEVLSIAAACGVQAAIVKPSEPTAVIAALDALLAAGPAPAQAVTEEEFAREHVQALKAKLLEKAAALDLSERRFRIISESAPVGILLADSTGSAIYANPRLVEITGAPVEELLGTGWLSWVEPTLREEIFGWLALRAVNGSRRHRVRVETAGRTLWLDIHLRRVSEDGERIGLVILFDDVTATVEAQERHEAALHREVDVLRRTAQLAHRLSEAQRVVRSGTWDFDPDTGAIALGPQLRDLLGTASPTWHCGQLHRHIHASDLDRLKARIDHAARTGGRCTDEIRMTHADGSTRHTIFFCEPVADPEAPTGANRRLWGVIQDITDLREAQQSAAQARADRLAERRILELFQAAMLPRSLPDLPGADLGATYVAAPDRLDIGGDWYDACCLPDGRVLLSVGDVAGHDQRAAATMGPMRAVLRAFALEDPEPAALLARLNRYVVTGHPTGTLITAVVAVYDPSTRELSWANAGHPDLLLVTAGGRAPRGADVALLADRGPALGISPRAAYPTGARVLPPATALCCYTDGLVERRRGADQHDNQTWLIDAVATAFTGVAAAAPGTTGSAEATGSPAQRLVDRITDAMLAPFPAEDDVCVLVLWTR